MYYESVKVVHNSKLISPMDISKCQDTGSFLLTKPAFLKQ